MLVGSCARCGTPTTLRCTFCGRTICKNCMDADERFCPDCVALQKKQKGVANVRLPPSRQG